MDFSILIVEDDTSIRETLCDLLTEEGYRCAEARDGEDALQKLKGNKFDLLLTDFRMPRMDGIELIQTCRSLGLDLPTILITANRDLLPLHQKILDDNGILTIKKPLDFNLLLATIKNATMGA